MKRWVAALLLLPLPAMAAPSWLAGTWFGTGQPGDRSEMFLDTMGADGKFRAVIALTDPGVPNWLDPAGFTEGTIYGRWYDCSSHPTPTLKRVKLADLAAHLPPDTPHVTPEQRAAELAARVRGCQRRRRW